MSLQLSFYGTLPPHFEQAISELLTDLRITLAENGIPVVARKGDALAISYDGEKIALTWAQPVQFYRALSLLPQPLVPFSKNESPCFETVGLMFDASRNAVLKPETWRFFFRKMSMMGLNLGMIYTEDTYQVPSQPYFGYQRGRYSIDELRALDDYANLFGIELCPCIQTLGHLDRALHWPAHHHLRDNDEVILADLPETYAYLEELITAASAPYRSKRIHLGMDEAFGIGLGNHLVQHGYESSHAIIKRHLAKILEITRAKGLSPMMWSDMYFTADSLASDYYNSRGPSAASIACVNPDVTLVFWDYYHIDKQKYAELFEQHAKFPTQTVFAGGIWTWISPAPDYNLTLATTIPALTASKEANIPLVFATAWGDNGAECNLLTTLLGLQLYAEFTYTGAYDKDVLATRFARVCQADADAFWNLTRFNFVEGMVYHADRPVNAAKFLLYQDPLVQLFSADTKELAMAKHYEKLAVDYAQYAAENSTYSTLFDFYWKLAKVLASKCYWHEHASDAVRGRDWLLAQELIETLEQTILHVEILRLAWRDLWESTNRPHGFEVIDLRLGGVRARLSTAATRMQEWIDGKVDDIPELSTQALPYILASDGSLQGCYKMSHIQSACKIDG